MNAFVVTAPADPPANPEITSGAFFPTVSLVDLRESARIDGTVTTPRLVEVVVDAIASVNAELKPWRERQLAAGYASLADVPGETVNDVSVNVHRYRRAVGCLAKAALMERYRDFDSTARGDRKADVLENPIDDIRRDARWAISDILGVPRVTVELI